MSCLDSATAVMHSPGHLRIRVPGLYRAPEVKRTLESRLAGVEHVSRVMANPLTGKVLVLFDPAVPVAAMLDTLGVKPVGDRAARGGASQARGPPVPTPAKERGKRLQPGEVYPAWHLRSAEDALAHHAVSRTAGLSSAEAGHRLREGLNLLPQPRTRSPFELLAGQFRSLPVGLLGISAVLSLATGGIAEAIAIAAVLALNGGIGYVTEKRAEATIASLSELIDGHAPVVRDGAVAQVPTSHIVPGDLLVLAPGVHVPADARVVRSTGLSADESALTGESRAAHKRSAALSLPAALADRANMVYMGTSMAAGTGLAVVVGTGARTEIGAIQAAMEVAERPRTPIQKEMDSLGNRLVTISCLICLAVFGLGLLRGQGWLQMLKSSISLAIAAVPEGLPTVATTSLARGLRIMRARRMLIRRLQAVETIGAIHSICFDKTGTLTMNRMAAVAVTVGTQPLPLADGRLAPVSRPGPDHEGGAVARLLQLCVLSNETLAHGNDPAAFLSSGSATENALVRLAEEAGIGASMVRRAFPLLHAELRAEGRNHMRTVHAAPDGGRLVAIKGSPLEVLGMCMRMQRGDEVVELDDELRCRIERENMLMARQQLRVLGFAYARQAASTAAPDDSGNLVWVGLVGLADPLRSGARQVIAQLHRAGIRTTMVTGDQHATAYAIGKELGLAGGPEPRILDSERLGDIGPDELAASAAAADIFARVSPAKKLHIVRALQRGGAVVGMTGDGINDGPALRAADVGIAMGLHGSDLARSAADVVLADDRLETVLDAIRQGRTITNNIEKSLHFLISSNLSEILLVLGAVAATGAAPLTPMQLLWLNLLSDVLPAIALAAEPAEGDVMERPPREPNTRLIANDDLKRYGVEGTILAGGAMAAYGYGLLRYGGGARAGSLAFNSLVLGQLLHAYLCRSKHQGLLRDGATERNRRLDLAIGGSIGLQALANLVPGLRGLLGIGATSLPDLGVVLLGAVMPIFINNARKHRGGGAA
jgi:Ca2+-transporting ATPase